MSTLHFSAEQFIKPDVLAGPLDWFKKEMGVTEATKLYLNVLLLNLAAEAVAAAWCRRGGNFALGWIENGGLLRRSTHALRQLGIVPDMEQNVVFRMCLGLVEYEKCVNWRWLFTVYQQWYDGQVAFVNSDLQTELARLSVVIYSPTIPGLSCTFNPWTLVFEKGDVTFTNK